VKEIGELTVIAITALTTLLIMGMVLLEFKTLDTTLLAGIIAFVGAIIGGSITLIGVKMTLENAKEKDELNNLHARKHALDKTIIELSKARDSIYRNKRQKKSFEGALGGMISSFVHNNGILDNAASSSRKVYGTVLKLDNYIDKLRWDKELRDYTDDIKYYLLEVELNICIHNLREEKQVMINKLLEKHPE